MATQILKDISNERARAMLAIERRDLEAQRAQQLRDIRAAQHALDRINQRLQEVEQGERILSNHG